jgi:hypothetical protein
MLVTLPRGVLAFWKKLNGFDESGLTAGFIGFGVRELLRRPEEEDPLAEDRRRGVPGESIL